MTDLEVNNFYGLDKEEYILSKNDEFLNWLSINKKNGYTRLINIEELQKLIDCISNWYEFKYPERQFMNCDGRRKNNFEFVDQIKASMKLDEIVVSNSNMNYDLQLIKRIFQLVALNLLYSKYTTPERGYQRAKIFIYEFNSCIPNLNLSTDYIDDLMRLDYSCENIDNNREDLINKVLTNKKI